MIELILAKVRILIADNPTFSDLSDELLLLYIVQAYSEALGYCNARELPVAAVSTIALMALDIIPRSHSGADIQSLSEGNRSVTYRAQPQSGTMQEVYKKALNKYKAVHCL